MQLDPEVYRNAAARIIERKANYCCTALRDILCPSVPISMLHLHDAKYITRLEKHFRPRHYGSVWWTYNGEYFCPYEARIFALLLMADIIEYENKNPPPKPMKKRLASLLSKASAPRAS